MALAINNNLMANNVTRNLQGHYGKLGQSTQRLSSGLRVSSASDDAAGLAIRELMRADIAALGQGVRNANDGISMIQTADGALGVIDSKLIRMKELAEQATTGTYTNDQRQLIDKEYQAMAKEITRIAEDTDFNGKKLLNGSDQGLSDIVREAKATTIASHIKDEALDGTVTLTATANDTIKFDDTNSQGIKTTTTYTQKIGDKLEYNLSANKVTETQATAAVSSKIDDASLKAALAGATSINIQQADTVNDKFTDVAMTAADGTFSSTAGKAVRITATFGEGKERVITISESKDSVLKFTSGGIGVDGTFAHTAGTDKRIVVTTEDKGTTNLHFGSSSASTDSYNIGVGNATATGLGVGEGAMDNVLTAAGAKTALDNIGKAIAAKDGMRADLGSTQNRLQATIENISIQKENLQAAESRISDVDVATEMTEFNKQQILANAAVSMLSQANNLPKMAQKLLG